MRPIPLPGVRGMTTAIKRDVAPAAPHGLTGPVPFGTRDADREAPIHVLQIAEDFCGTPDVDGFVMQVIVDEFRAYNRRRAEGDECFAWLATVDYHPKALIYWVGVSANMPPSVLDFLELMVRSMGFPTARATVAPRSSSLAPVLYLGDDGLETLRLF